MIEYNHSNLFNNTVNISSNINSNLYSITILCNGMFTNPYKPRDSMIASAILSMVTNIVFSIVSITGNGLTIYVIAFRLGFTSFAFRGIFMISVFSILYSSVAQVFFTLARFHDLVNYYHCQLRIVGSVMGYICQCGLYTTISALAIDRYIAVVHHKYYNARKVYYIYVTLSIITVIVWMPLIAMSFLKILSLRIFKILASAYLVVHFVTIAFTYVNVMLKLAKHSKNRVEQLGASMQEEELEKKRRMEARRQNSVLFIIGTHGFSMLAKAVCFAVRVGLPANYELEYHCQRSTQFLLILNAALHPILYAWRIDTLRKEMMKIVKGKMCFSSAAEVEPNA